MSDDVRLAVLAGLLVQADADVATAFAYLPRWDCSAALLQGELTGLLRAFRIVADVPDSVTDDDALTRARALAGTLPAAAVGPAACVPRVPLRLMERTALP